MNLYYSPVSIAVIAIQYGLWTVFFCLTLKSRFSLKRTVPAALLLFIPYCVVRTLTPYIGLMRILLPSVMLYLELLLLFKDYPLKKFVALFCVLLPVAVSEVLLAVVMLDVEALSVGIPNYYNIPQQCALAVVYLSVQTALLIISYAIWKTTEEEGTYSIEASSWFAYFFFPCSQYIVLAEWYLNHITDSFSFRERAFFIVSMLIYTIADIALLYMIRGNIKRVKLEERNEALSHIINMQSEYYPALAEHYDDMRKLRHDIANHMYTIKVLLEAQDIESAKSYANELAEKSAYTSSLGSCKNHVIDSFLYHRIKQLRESGIEVNAQVALPESCSVSNTELISAFSNMLDNAEEACRMTDDKFIDLLCLVRKGYITISVGNPSLPPSGKAKARRIPEIERGLGSQILNELALKYSGNFIASFKDGMYTAYLTMKEGN